MAKLTTLLLPMTVFALACGPDGSGSSSDQGAGSSSGEAGTDTGSATSNTTGGSVDETGPAESSGGMPAQDVPARGGITVSLVEANPGVAVPIGADGEWVGPEGRNAPLSKGRNTAVRVYVDVDEESWVQRDIEARLHIHLPDQSVETMSELATISGDSSTASLQSGFIFGVVAEWMVPGVRYQVELYEAGTGWEGLPEQATPPATPAEPDYIGVEGTELNMKIVMVPVQYSSGGCSETVDATDEVLAPYEDSMFQQNPLETIEISWDDPYVVNDLDLSNPNDFFALLGRAQQYRASQNPAPNVYYYMLFDNCGSCIGDGGGCLLGVAPGTADSSMAAASLRVAIGTRYLGGSEVGIETFVHELGHTQGREHIACPDAAAAGPDISYPHDEGKIGVWGFGVRDFQVRNASSHYDYMSYCSPTWVSDWQWSATYDRIAILTAWDAAQVSIPEDQAVLVGAVNLETGQAQWWTDRGGISHPDQGHSLRFMAGESVLDSAQVQIDAWSEGPMITVRAPLPAGYDDEVTGIEYLGPDRSFAAPRSEVTSYHRAEALTEQ
jgi:hypothetical protein